MTTFKYVCIPVKSEKEGIEAAEDLIGSMRWNNDEHKRPQAWPYDNDNPIIVMDSPLSLETQLAEAQADADHWKGECNALQRMVHEARAEIERKDKLIEQMRELLQLKNAILGHCRFVTYPPKKIIEKLEKIEAALLAAERGE